jgi:hypothetical protein
MAFHRPLAQACGYAQDEHACADWTASDWYASRPALTKDMSIPMMKTGLGRQEIANATRHAFSWWMTVSVLANCSRNS